MSLHARTPSADASEGGRRRRRLAALTLAGAMIAAPLATVVAQTATAATTATTVDVRLNVLVMDNGDPGVGALMHRMDVEGIQYTRLDLTNAARTPLTAAALATSDANGIHAQYSGVILPSDAPAGLSADELTLLRSYEKTFQVREVASYNWANPSLGLNYAGYSGSIDGMTGKVDTAAAGGAFNYLSGTMMFDDNDPDVLEAYGYLATPVDAATVAAPATTITPVVTAAIPGTTQQGVLVGTRTAADGHEQMVMTFSANQWQQHSKVLDHGILRWVTRDMSTSINRNQLSVHIDDIFLPDFVWNLEGNCTYAEPNCDPVKYDPNSPQATTRMVPSDVTRLINWQNASGIKLDMTYNGGGSVEYAADHAGKDPLKDALLANKSQLRWINHTYDHPYLGCIQNLTVIPWQCATNANGSTQWYSYQNIYNEISQNKSWAFFQGITANINGGELVTGEHSGLKTLPQMPTDNPNLGPALTMNGIKWVAADNSREKTPRQIGSATTLPRWPMNIYYNAATKAQETDEYNFIYTSAADGGSDNCVVNASTTTCIKPLDMTTGFDSYIVPLEKRIALSHMLDNDPRPHYAHQSNLAQDGILYPVLDAMLSTYKATYATNSPVVNPTMSQAGTEFVNQYNWSQAKAGVTATVKGTTVTVKNATGKSVTTPVTLQSTAKNSGGVTAFGNAYGGQRSSWVNILGGSSATYQTGAATGFATTAVWPAPAPAPTTTTVAPAPTTTTVAPAPTTTTVAPAPTTTTVAPAPTTTTATTTTAVATTTAAPVN